MAGGSSPYAGLTFGALGTGGYGADAWVSDWTTPSDPNHQRLVFYQNTGVLAVVPEPSTYAMALAGLACGGWRMWRRRRLICLSECRAYDIGNSQTPRSTSYAQQPAQQLARPVDRPLR